MICLADALRKIEDPAAEPCPPCLAESRRSPYREALAAVTAYFKKESEAHPAPDLSQLPPGTWRPTLKTADTRVLEAREYHRKWRQKKRDGLTEPRPRA